MPREPTDLAAVGAAKPPPHPLAAGWRPGRSVRLASLISQNINRTPWPPTAREQEGKRGV